MGSFAVLHATHNLHVLAALAPNDKLSTNDSVFRVFPPSSLRAGSRWWYGEGREKNATRISETVRGSMSATLTHLSIPHSCATTDALAYLRLHEAILNVRQGLRSLAVTYADDAALCSFLNVLHAEIDDFAFLVETPVTNLRRAMGSDAVSKQSCPLRLPQ